MHYVLDTCIFNKVLDGFITEKDLPDDGDYLISHVQMDELLKTPEEERRAKLMLRLVGLRPRIVPTESMVLGVSRLGYCKLSDDGVYADLKRALDLLNKNKRNNHMDALIAEVAIKNGYTLITTDKDLYAVTRELGCRVWKLGIP